MSTFKRRIIAVIMSVIMVLSCFAGLTFSVGAESVGSYTVLTDGTIEISKFYGGYYSYNIPSSVNGRPVTSIGQYAFSNCTDLVSVTIPDSVTNISNFAFAYCDNLAYVKMSNNVVNISSFAFVECFGLTSINLPASVEYIGTNPFTKCYNLDSILISSDNRYYKSVNGVLFSKDMTELIAYPGGRFGAYTIPNSVKEIGWSAFRGCEGLTSITIPNGVNKIGGNAFEDCVNLETVTIPQSVSYIADGAFESCSLLQAITVADSNKNYKSYDGVLFDKKMEQLISCPAGRGGKYVIPDGVVSINIGSFSGCDKLTDIYIPDKVTSIGDYAFLKCDGIEKIILPTSVSNIGSSAFAYCSSLNSIKIPSGITKIGDYTFFNCASLVDVIIPNSVRSIGDSAFSLCERLVSVTIPNGVSSIGKNAFAGCKRLASVSIPNSATAIGDEAFIMCDSLHEVIIPSSVVSIGKEAFGYSFDSAGKIVYVDFVMYGYPMSAAQRYASENELKFVFIDLCEHTSTALRNKKDATCTESGYTGDKVCLKCNETVEYGVEIPALGHSEVTIKGKNATCTATGLTDGVKCSACGKIIKAQKEIPALGHSEVTIKGKSATCTETGLTDGVKCSVCGEVIKAQEEIAAIGHKFDKGVCTVCGAIDPDYKVVLESVSEQIKVDNETKTVVLTPAGSSGMKISEFKSQFNSEIDIDIGDNELIANGAKFKFGGSEFTVIVKGDVNGDGKISALDARTILRISAKLDRADNVTFSAADVNSDGKVTAGEARRVLRFSAKLEKSISN